MFLPILMNMFNHWFALGAIPGNVTKGVIRLLKKGGSHDYRSITLLYTELKILARVFANRLQLVIIDLIGPEQNLHCEGMIDPKQLALGERGPRGDRRRHRSRTDTFGSVQGLR